MPVLQIIKYVRLPNSKVCKLHLIIRCFESLAITAELRNQKLDGISIFE